MFRPYTMLAVLLASVCLLAALPAAAEDRQSADAQQEAQDKARVIKDLDAAARLVELGRTRKAPEALLSAGSMLDRVHKLTGWRSR